MGDEYEEEFEEEEEEIIEVPVFHKKVAHNLSSYVTEFNQNEAQAQQEQAVNNPPEETQTPPVPTSTVATPAPLFKPAAPKRVQSYQVSSSPVATGNVPKEAVKRPSEKKDKKEKKSLDSSGNLKEKTKKSSSRSSVVPNNDQLKNEVERLRNLVNILSTKIENFEREVQLNTQKVATPAPPSETKEKEKEKDKDESNPVLSSILQQGPSSDPSQVLDLIENDKAIYHSGWMSKKGRKVRNWKKRWFVLKGNKLSYFNKEGEKNALGEINLETCMIDELKEREESGRPCMALLVEGRKLFFCADTPEENRRWYLYLVCKNSELSYLRKLKHLGKQADNSVLSFLEHPMVKEIRLDFKELTIDSVVSLVGPLRIHETLTVVSLKHSSVDDLCLSTLCEAIKTNISIETLELDDNYITSEGAKHLAKVLSANPVLKSISLRGNKLKDEGIIEISKVLSTGCHPRLVELNLDRNDIGQSGAIELANALTRMPRFPVIALSDNHIGDQGAEAIIRLCSMNNSVTTLKLENNGIGFNGVAAIANYLRENNSVTHLYLSSNNFEQSSVRLLTQTLMTNTSLQYAEFASYKLDSSNLCALRLLSDCQFFG